LGLKFKTDNHYAKQKNEFYEGADNSCMMYMRLRFLEITITITITYYNCFNLSVFLL